jgi:zinc-binding alcohol dehydrogenase/oxidoreductase
MIQFIEEHQLRPVLDQMYPLEQYEQAFNRLEKADQLGKIGLYI